MWFLKSRDKPVMPKPGPWDGLAAVEIERVAASLAVREVRSALIDTYLASKTFSAGVYVGSRIKENIDNKVRRSMDIPKEDAIKVVFDGTHFGSVKNGFVVSVDGLYWKEFWGSPQFTNWQAISIAQARQRLIFKPAELLIDNAKIAMTFGYYSAKDLETVICGILEAFHSWASQDR